jgi:hypothetical protein
MATGFEAWAGVFYLAGHWFGMGGGKKLPARLLAKGDQSEHSRAAAGTNAPHSGHSFCGASPLPS